MERHLLQIDLLNYTRYQNLLLSRSDQIQKKHCHIINQGKNDNRDKNYSAINGALSAAGLCVANQLLS